MGCIGGEYSGMVDRFVMSDLVDYQLGNRGCALLLVLFFYKGYIFRECFGYLVVSFPIC